jgi:cell division protein FtsB
MQEFQKKQKTRRIIYSIPSLVVLILITFFLTKGAVRVLNKERDSRERSRDLVEKASALVLREQELRESITNLQTEEGLKDEIKERFSVTQTGEYVAVIVDERKVASSTEQSIVPWYKKFWNAIIRGK